MSAGVEAALTDLDKCDIVRRIWQKDHTVWKSEPKEITNRLGWLQIADLMFEQIQELQSFTREIIGAGFRNVVLLGMGGSSLGPEVLRQVFGNTVGYPKLKVLDSMVPAWIQSVNESINPTYTLFVVASKSGTTTEPLALFNYFKDRVESHVGQGQAGQNFIAITDPGTPLVELAENEGFRRVFLNPPDVGGRYSVLSYFGLVPTSLTGIDTEKLLERSVGMREACASSVPVHDNPGAWLGAYMGTLAAKGRDKLTFVTSPIINSFGLWVEQLIAESTGKEGKGIIPVTGEPLVSAENYCDDRLFIYMRLDDDDNAAMDTFIEQMKVRGHPVLTLNMRDNYDLGAEFFRWEFATAVAGAILGINPFDQPDVQRAKDVTEGLLKEYMTNQQLPERHSVISLSDLLAKAEKNNYLAIMAYLHQTTETDRVFAELRQKVMMRYRIATTLGYGPRFLHSTGQLHKGGPDSGLFLQVTEEHDADIPIPQRSYTFGLVADAQAMGDFKALESLGRNVTWIQIYDDDEENLSELVREL